MRKTRFTEFQIVKILKAAEGGRAVTGICREHGTSSATYYKWKSKYGGMEASDIRRMKALEAENARLKQMFAELSLENKVLKDVIEKNSEAGSTAGVRGVRFKRTCHKHPQGLCGVWREPELLRLFPSLATTTR